VVFKDGAQLTVRMQVKCLESRLMRGRKLFESGIVERFISFFLPLMSVFFKVVFVMSFTVQRQ
jgi:hypothetical protein